VFWVAGILTFLVCWSYLPSRHLWFLPSLLSLTVGNLAFYLTHDEWLWYLGLPFALLVTAIQFTNVLWITYVTKLLVKAALKNPQSS